MAGRPPLRIGSHGKITRKYVGGGVWLARTRFRDSDGVTRIVERRRPADEHDHHGKQAEDALIEALGQRLAPGGMEARSTPRSSCSSSVTSTASRRTAALCGRSIPIGTTRSCWARSSLGFANVVTMGCGDACPFLPGKRYENWELPDPAGQGIEAVRLIRDDVEARVRQLFVEPGVNPVG
jgi:protein-tyrosine-phosphatase